MRARAPAWRSSRRCSPAASGWSEASSSRAGGVISSTSSCGPSTTIPGASTPVMRRAASKRSDARMPRAIAPVSAASASASRCWNAPLLRAAGDVHGAPHAPADDERGAQLVGDVGRQEQVAVARAALGVAAGDVVEDADGHPPRGEAGEGVDVVDHVLAADDQLPGGRGLVGREHAALDELLGRVAGQQPRAGVQRVPAAGVVVDDVAQPRRQLGEELLARQSP